MLSYRKTFAISALALLVIGIPLFTFATDASYKARKTITVPSGQTIDGDFFAAGEEVEISGTVRGDVYAAGANIVIDGTVEGDVLAAGGSVRITGTVDHDIRIAGGQLDIGGAIGGNATVTGGDITFSEAGSVNGNVVVAGGNVVLASHVGGDVTSAGGTVSVSGDVDGKMDSHNDTLRLTSNARIGKTLTYASPREASIDENAKVTGGVTYNQTAHTTMPNKKIVGMIAGARTVKIAISFIAFLIVSLLIARFFPVFAESSRAILTTRFWAAAGVGALVLIATPVIAILLMVTIVGLPLGVIMILLYFPLLYIGKFAAIFAIGRLILKNKNAYWALLAGTAAYYAIMLIPVAGSLITSFVGLAGVGAWILAKKKLYGALKHQGTL